MVEKIHLSQCTTATFDKETGTVDIVQYEGTYLKNEVLLSRKQFQNLNTHWQEWIADE